MFSNQGKRSIIAFTKVTNRSMTLNFNVNRHADTILNFPG